MKRYEEYKKVDLPYLDEVPSHWDIAKNKRLLSLTKSKVSDKWSEYQLLSLTKQGVKKKDINNLTGKVPDSFEGYQKIKKGNLIMCLYDLDCSAVFSGLSNYDGMISPSYLTYDIEANSNKHFIDYWFKYIFIDRKYKIYSKSVRYTINDERFGDIDIVVPPLSEQTQIANYLDWKISEINKLIKIENEKIEEINKLKKQFLFEAMTNIEEKEVPLKRICSIIPGKEIKKEVDKNSEIAIEVYGSGSRPFKYTDEYLIDGQNIIFGRKGTIGKPFIVTGKKWIVDTAYAMTNNELSDFDFLYYVMCVFNWDDYVTNTVKPSIVANQIIQEKVSLPSLDKQKCIAKQIKKKNNDFDVAINYIQLKIMQLKSLKHSLISEVVTGKIDVRDIVIPKFETIDLEKEDSSDESSNELDVNEEIK